MPKKLVIVSLLVSACAGQSISGQAPVYKLLYSPGSGAPIGYTTAMFEVEPGLFYVLSSWESDTFGSTIFTVTSAGTFKSIYAFPPYTTSSVLVHGANGLLYGPGLSQGAASNPYEFYYSISPAGTNLKEYLPPGTYPSQWGSTNQTMLAPPGKLYDIIGKNVGNSAVYGFARIAETGKIAILHEFSTSDGVPSGGSLAYGADGNIYGVGFQHAGTSPGFIYRFTPSGVYAQLLSFPSTPASVFPPLIAAADGNLYGVFSAGGANNTGELYQVTLSGQYQLLASFPAYGANQPTSLMQASDGNIYGATNSGCIFRFNLTAQQLSKVYQLARDGGQGVCPCGIIEGMDGKLYAVAPAGGNIGSGAVFSLNIGLPKPTPVVSGLYPASGPVGQKVILWGNYLLGATLVTFNGTPASGVVATSVQSVYATVPVGATTGPVTITTANGSFTTTENFTVQ